MENLINIFFFETVFCLFLTLFLNSRCSSCPAVTGSHTGPAASPRLAPCVRLIPSHSGQWHPKKASLPSSQLPLGTNFLRGMQSKCVRARLNPGPGHSFLGLLELFRLMRCPSSSPRHSETSEREGSWPERDGQSTGTPNQDPVGLERNLILIANRMPCLQIAPASPTRDELWCPKCPLPPQA